MRPLTPVGGPETKAWTLRHARRAVEEGYREAKATSGQSLRGREAHPEVGAAHSSRGSRGTDPTGPDGGKERPGHGTEGGKDD